MSLTIIRPAALADTSVIADFNIRLAWETENIQLKPEIIKTGVQAVFNDTSKGFYLLAERDEGIAGQLLITTEWSDWRNKYFWWIQSVYVEQQHRGTGVFKALYSEVIDLARRSGSVCGIRLDVDTANIKAQETYQKLGMQPSNYLLYELEID